MVKKYKPIIKNMEYPKLSLLYGEPIALQSEHYNLYLQKIVENAGYDINSERILLDSAAICVYSMLSRLFEKNYKIWQPQERLEIASDIYSYLGFGLLPAKDLSIHGGKVVTPSTHYTLGWKNKWGKRDKPVDYFTCGFLQAAMSLAYSKPLGAYQVKQSRCLTMGEDENEFVIQRRDTYKQYSISPGVGILPPKYTIEEQKFSQLDTGKITQWMLEILSTEANNGLLSLFGIPMTRHFANYYNYLSFELEKEITGFTGDSLLAREMLIEVANYGAFYTFGNMMKSEEWYHFVVPNCKIREDWIASLVTCINTFGWGSWEIRKVVPNDKLLIRVYGGYESNFFLRNYEKSEFSKSYFATGIAGGIMNLLYNIDITQKPELSDEFFEETFDTEFSFVAVQTSSRCMGDDYCEFEARGLF